MLPHPLSLPALALRVCYRLILPRAVPKTTIALAHKMVASSLVAGTSRAAAVRCRRPLVASPQCARPEGALSALRKGFLPAPQPQIGLGSAQRLVWPTTNGRQDQRSSP